MARHRKRHTGQPPAPWYRQTTLLFPIIGIIILLGLFAVVSITLGGKERDTTPSGVKAEQAGDKQVIRMSVDGIDFNPSSFIVKQDVPVEFIVDGTNAVGCTSILVSRDFGFNEQLERGENIITFTPAQKGTFQFSCGMNMVQGTITVV